MDRSPEGSFVQIVMADTEHICTFQPIQYTHSPNLNSNAKSKSKSKSKSIVMEGVMVLNILDCN